MGSVYLFVYGSLKRGGRHHDELRGSKCLGSAKTLPGYSLAHLGDYLALIKPEPDAELEPGAPRATETAVSGELFEIDEALLPALDELEGDDYERAEVALDASQSAHLRFALAYFKKAR
jgi:gamma-glutamylaminecyclotransferase